METSYLKTLELDKIIARAAEGCVCKESREDTNRHLKLGCDDYKTRDAGEILCLFSFASTSTSS